MAATLLTVVGAGCGGPPPTKGGPRVVFADQDAFRDSGPVHRQEVFDIGLPLLHNVTGHPVRIRYVQWVNKPAAVRIVSIDAYNYRQLGHGIDGAEGNLPIACPKEFHPSAISSFTTAPHSDSAWFVLLAFAIDKVGTYHLDRVKIGYSSDGHQGWQYQHLNITMRVHNPPWPGPIPPLPKSVIC